MSRLFLCVLGGIFCIGSALSQEVPSSREQINLSFSPVVRQTAPAVVNIFTKTLVKERQVPSLFNDPFFQRFFGNNLPGRERQRQGKSLGSGVIVRSNGLVITNHHVIEGATEIQVVLADRREFSAELVLSDEGTDLAVLKIDTAGEELPTLELMDSDRIDVGDLVLAIGNPFGVGQTVTSGIVSALARTRVGIADYQFFIQTDAAINPGNSGGALVTMDGKLLGINTAIFASKGGGSIGIGFAIPANMVRTVIRSAEEGHGLVRAWTGLIGQNLTSDLAQGFGLSRPGGIVVSSVFPGGPADQAGLKAGDVILSAAGQEVTNVDSLRFRVATIPVGDEIQIGIWRGRKAQTLRFVATQAPEIPQRDMREILGSNPLAGATVANLSPALSEELDISGLWEGVIISNIARRSPAHRIGLQPGDILLGVNGSSVKLVSDVEPALAKETEKWQLVIRRNGRQRVLEFSRKK
ncbi:Do family serine endopeptidase [Kiloniella laminariae]|uniref:Do family serine endopeptidase n=1 Tax=Kiloniella laminariae TaxID=454162 RepID=A0ABT4LPD6_9PROT|nr:Do family serine endopeptidase [Kiloniella laminariae]MCZ4282988.1 Do family serine endopeptidase [Kiloniella laminariae]